MSISHITDANISISHTIGNNQSPLEGKVIELCTKTDETINKILQLLDNFNERLTRIENNQSPLEDKVIELCTKTDETINKILQLLDNFNERLTRIENNQSFLKDKITELCTKVEQSRSIPIPPPLPSPSSPSYSSKTHVEDNEHSMPKKENTNTPRSNRGSSDLQAVPGLLEELLEKLNKRSSEKTSPSEDAVYSPINNLRRTQSCRIKLNKKQPSGAESEADDKPPARVKKPLPLPTPFSLPSHSLKTHVENNEKTMPKKKSSTDLLISKEKVSNSQLAGELKVSEIHQANSEPVSSSQAPVCTNTLKDEAPFPVNGLRRTQSCRIKSCEEQSSKVRISFADKRQIFEKIRV